MSEIELQNSGQAVAISVTSARSDEVIHKSRHSVDIIAARRTVLGVKNEQKVACAWQQRRSQDSDSGDPAETGVCEFEPRNSSRRHPQQRAATYRNVRRTVRRYLLFYALQYGSRKCFEALKLKLRKSKIDM